MAITKFARLKGRCQMTVPSVREVRLEDRYAPTDREVLLTGLQALVRLPLELSRRERAVGRRTAVLLSGYEGSPLAGYDLELERQRDLMTDADVLVRPAVNEELAVNVVQGSQLAHRLGTPQHDGVIGIWYGKAPGLDRASDAMRHANLGGADRHGGVLVLVGDDATAKSSTVPSRSDLAMAEIGLVVLAPSDPQDILRLGLHGLRLSRHSGLWVGMKLATNVIDGSGLVDLSSLDTIGLNYTDDLDIDDTTARRRPGNDVVPAADSAADWKAGRSDHEVTAQFLQPTLGELEHSAFGSRTRRALEYARAHDLNRVLGDPHARVGVVTSGATFSDVAEALRTLGISLTASGSGVRVLQLGLLSPLDPTIIRSFAEGLDEVVVVEEKRAYLETGVKDVLYGTVHQPAVTGKFDPDGAVLFKAAGDLPHDLIAQALSRRFADHGIAHAHASKPEPPAVRRELPLIQRTPFFCSGCPHNRSTVVPEGSLVGAGIGCSALATLANNTRSGEILGLSQMGGEGAAWIGMAPFVAADHAFQNLGDGTYHHSGSLAVRAAIAAGVNITYKILYNDTVAMTGGQQAVGRMAVPSLVQELIAEGVTAVAITTEDPRRYRGVRLPGGVRVHHRDRLVEVQEQLRAKPGVTVLIHDQACATELRRKRKRGLVEAPTQKVFINERACEGCGDCGAKSNCLSVQPVETEYGRKTQIHQGSCNIDLSCLSGDCPSFITVHPRRRTKAHSPGSASSRRHDPRAIAHANGDALPAPELVVPTTSFGMRITGIGGTGVVTVSQVIATAATMAGFHVRGLDQLGMAQKGGAVVSDLRLSRTAEDRANKLGAGEADLHLACDVLVAADPANLRVMATERTVAVVSAAVVPTGAMVTQVDTAIHDPARLADEVVAHGRRVESRALDPAREVRELGLPEETANVLLLGVAVQAGALPISPEFIEEALRLNRVAVDENLAAFSAGRRIVAHGSVATGRHANRDSTPARRASLRDSWNSLLDPASLPQSLADLVETRASELADYQSQRYAQDYVKWVAGCRELLRASALSASEKHELLSHCVEGMFKLAAYKDEYEVARLCLDPSLSNRIHAQFGTDVRWSYMLHPPVLRALGLRRKLAIRAGVAKPVLQVLRAMRRVRGTRFDPFGYAHVRREERRVIGEYQTAALRSLVQVTPANQTVVAGVLGAPDIIRGYEGIKLENIVAFRRQVDALTAKLEESAAG